MCGRITVPIERGNSVSHKAVALVQADCQIGEKSVIQSKHLFICARRNDKKITNDSVNVGAHGCISLLTNSRENGVLEDPVKPLLVKSIGHLTLCVVG